MSSKKHRALFLDRDGVINIDHGYVHRREDFHFIHGIFELILEANRLGYLVVVVTNQAGIGRGYYTEDDFHALTNWMREVFDQRGAHIDAVYFCPDHPEHGIGKYRRESSFRKPNPGMMIQASQDLDIDLSKSLMVGDKVSDMQAARAAGIPLCISIGQDGHSHFSVPVSCLQDVLALMQNQALVH